jgi:subtilase family serine protease
MTRTLGRTATAIAVLPVLSAAALAQPAPSGTPQPRITQAVDESQRVVRPTANRREATPANDRGALLPNEPIEHIQLQLALDDANEQRLADFVAAQHDPKSAQFHNWLTPDDFGARFGVAQADIDRIVGWLTSYGFQINVVYPNRTTIDFSGTAGQVARAFHTEMHRFEVNGVSYFANVGDPELPAALAPVVAGIVSLNDFPPKPKVSRRPIPKDTGSGASAGFYVVGPADLATIYNFNAAFKAGYTGKGQSIYLAEDTNLFNNSDWTTFRSVFQLSTWGTATFSTVHPAPKGGAACGNPGVNSDDVEAALDVEWASAAAPAAGIVLASCNGTAATDGVTQAIENLVNSSASPAIISVSYGLCEAEIGAAGNLVYYKTYQQAAAEGVSVFVATGDNGPSDCAYDGEVGTQYGVGANGWATTPYNVAVGGTDFSDTYSNTNSTYWASGNTSAWGSAKSYVPEIPWNGTCASPLLASYNGYSVTYGDNGFCNSSLASAYGYTQLDGGEGAPSGCATGTPSITGVVSGTCKGYPKPKWQGGVVGIPQDAVRNIPDVALFASNGVWGHYLVECFTDVSNGGGPCTGNPANWAGDGGGTSFATPIWAGIQALLNQKTGKRWGNPAPALYALAGKEYGASGEPSCYADLGDKISSSCVFINVTTGNDASDCVPGSPNCYAPSGTLGVLSTSTTQDLPAYRAKVGYSFPTGLGTVNVFNLISAWP